MMIFNKEGKVLQTQRINLVKGYNSFAINTYQLAKGIYPVRMLDADGIVIGLMKLLVQ